MRTWAESSILRYIIVWILVVTQAAAQWVWSCIWVYSLTYPPSGSDCCSEWTCSWTWICSFILDYIRILSVDQTTLDWVHLVLHYILLLMVITLPWDCRIYLVTPGAPHFPNVVTSILASVVIFIHRVSSQFPGGWKPREHLNGFDNQLGSRNIISLIQGEISYPPLKFYYI